jgi:5-methylcytosine-specific restriction enzyme subunit McrC
MGISLPSGLASMILRQKSLRDEQGGTLGKSFIVDMNALCERFVQAVVQQRVVNTDYTMEPHARRRLTSPAIAAENVVVPAINMRPDLLVKHGRKPVAVGDAKYKELLRIGDWDHPDIYQLIAYCVRLNLDRGLLIYPGKRPLTRSEIIGADLSIDTVGIDLGGSPQQILQGARAAADALFSQAASVVTAKAAA